MPGVGRGEVFVLGEPLSFWGGVDPATGRIEDVHHGAHGESVAGKVLVMPHSRGSSSAANTLAEAIHRGAGPAAIVVERPDEMMVLGAAVAGELYGKWVPVAVASSEVRATLVDGTMVEVSSEGIRLIASDG